MDWSRLGQRMPIFEMYHSETDRGAAIVAASLFDNLLERILRGSMISNTKAKFFEGYGPMASLSAKIELARFLGLIGRGQHHSLHVIRKVRNAFAHSLDHELSFESSPVRDHIHQLWLPLSRLFETEEHKTLRQKFTSAVGAHAGALIGILQDVKPAPEPADFISALSSRV